MLLEAKRINKIRRNYFTGRKTINKLEPMYLEFKLKEAKFKWLLKNEKQRTTDLFARQNAVSNARVRSWSKAEIKVVIVG